MDKEKNFVSGVVYVHNSKQHISSFLEMLIDVFETNFLHSEIICVNDASSDDSKEIIKRCAEKASETTVSVINMSYFHGLEGAMAAGVDLSIGDFLFEFDTSVCDYDKSEIMNIYRKALTGFDIVSASPDSEQKFTSTLFYSLFDRFSSVSNKLTTESFRILSRRAVNRIDSINKSIPYRKAVYANCGLQAANVKYKTVNTSKNKHDKKERIYKRGLAIDSLILFTDVGYRFALGMAFVMMAMVIFMAIYSFYIYLSQSPVAGWTTTILFLSAAFFGLFGVLAVIIKYLQILVNLVFKRKQYSFESIEKLTR